MKIELSEKTKTRLTRKPGQLEKHVNNMMLGQTLPYLSKQKNTLDVGGRNGLYSSYFVQHSQYVYAFEAVEPVYEALKELEKDYNNFTAYNLAVSNFIGQSDFYVDTKRLSNSSFNNLVDGQLVQVNTVTLDSMNFNNVGFVKIDVEGFELNVLQGAKELLHDNKPVCMIEIYPKFNNGPVENTFNHMFDLNYLCYYYDIKQQKLIQVSNTLHGTEVAHGNIKTHDGDFLFIPSH